MANEKKFYAVITEVWGGTQFDENEYISYYGDKNLAETEFEKAKREIIGEFEECYEEDDNSIKIVIMDDNMPYGERVCRITVKDGDDDSDCCVVCMRELKMICQ